MSVQSIKELSEEIRACVHCAAQIEHSPKPIFQAGAEARVLIIGQAPGRLTHLSGKPWDDPSGVRLREWLGLNDEEFYDPEKVALVPMSFCFPGSGKSGDLKPLKDCAALWHERLLQRMPQVQLIVVIGSYAQTAYLDTGGRNLTEIVRNYELFLPRYFPLPHPSPRNRFWLKKNPWFEGRVLCELRQKVCEILQ